MGILCKGTKSLLCYYKGTQYNPFDYILSRTRMCLTCTHTQNQYLLEKKAKLDKRGLQKYSVYIFYQMGC